MKIGRGHLSIPSKKFPEITCFEAKPGNSSGGENHQWQNFFTTANFNPRARGGCQRLTLLRLVGRAWLIKSPLITVNGLDGLFNPSVTFCLTFKLA